MLRKNVKSLFTAILVILFMSVSLQAAEQINWGGFAQTWFSYNNNGQGYNIRRVMLKASGNINSNFTWYTQYGWNQQNPGLMDAAIKYKYNNLLQLKAGRFGVPGTIFGALTSSSKLTFVERPMIVKKWNGFNGYTGFRSVGLQLSGQASNLKYKGMVSNDQASKLYKPGITDTTYPDSDNLKFTGRLEYGLENIEAGIFASAPIVKDPVLNSYGIDVAYDKQPLKLSTGYIQGEREIKDVDITYSGFISHLSWQFDKFQPTFRYDLYNPSVAEHEDIDVDLHHNFTLGLNYYYSNNIKIQANYLLREEKMFEDSDKYDNNLFYINLQYRFSNN